MEPVLKAADMADPHVEHLGVMAYAAYFQWIKARPKPADRLRVTPDAKTVRVHNPVSRRQQHGEVNIEEFKELVTLTLSMSSYRPDERATRWCVTTRDISWLVHFLSRDSTNRRESRSFSRAASRAEETAAPS